MQLIETDIKTREVLDWQGVHLIHFRYSSCSQKARIFLNLKNIDWHSHPINLARQKNYEDWFLGINPRGLVPVLIHDGAVHIESNDILVYLDSTFTDNKLIPEHAAEAIAAGLKEEDDLHLDIRALTMRFLTPGRVAQKDVKLMTNYATDSGTVMGETDPHKAVELNFWRSYAQSGITNERAHEAAHNFHRVYCRWNKQLSTSRYLTGDEITLLDIAWFIYTHRLTTAGYPFTEQHPQVHAWYEHLMSTPAFAKEVSAALPMRAVIAGMRAWQRFKGETMSSIAQFQRVAE